MRRPPQRRFCGGAAARPDKGLGRGYIQAVVQVGRDRSARRYRARARRYREVLAGDPNLLSVQTLVPSVQATEGVPEPDDTLLPGHDFPEEQGAPAAMASAAQTVSVTDAAGDGTKATGSTAERAIARFPLPSDPGCTGKDNCINFGGVDGFPYQSATDEERAAFRAVIARYARKGDSVTIKYLKNTKTQMPKVAGETKAACALWHSIDGDINIAECTSNPSYIRDWLFKHNRAHHAYLSDMLARSWQQQEGRAVPREAPEVPMLDPHFHEALESTDGASSSKSKIIVEGPDTVPYLDALAPALKPKRLDKMDNLIRAITHQCEVYARRDMNIDELIDADDQSFMRNFPKDVGDPREQYYLRGASKYATAELPLSALQ